MAVSSDGNLCGDLPLAATSLALRKQERHREAAKCFHHRIRIGQCWCAANVSAELHVTASVFQSI